MVFFSRKMDLLHLHPHLSPSNSVTRQVEEAVEDMKPVTQAAEATRAQGQSVLQQGVGGWVVLIDFVIFGWER